MKEWDEKVKVREWDEKVREWDEKVKEWDEKNRSEVEGVDREV